MKKAVILFSGGLDSTTCLAYAKSQGFDCHALSFIYGQRHEAELNAAAHIVRVLNVKHKIFELPIHQFGGSALTDWRIDVPDHEIVSNEIPVTYVPARNTIFLSIALAFAEVLESYDIFIGVSAVDYSGYPDCRPQYVQAFETMANLALKQTVDGLGHLNIHTPLIHLSKAQTVQLGHSLGIDYGLTVSCYRATPEGLACGTCSSCMLRKKGFAEAALHDPTRYVNTP